MSARGEDIQRLTDLLRKIHADEAERPRNQAMFEAMVQDMARKQGVSEDQVCREIAASHDGACPT